MPEPKPDPPPAPPPQRDLATRIVRNVAGIVLLLAGIAGLFLPILQGVLMIVGGLALIDLPIKGKAHRWLLRYGFYQRISQKYDGLLARWRARRAQKR